MQEGSNQRPRSPSVTARSHNDRLIVGRLQAHGPARYQFRADQDVSYYVKLTTDRGTRTLWGKDLERALVRAETLPKVGDLVGAQRVAREAVTVTDRQRNPDGQVLKQSEYTAHRYRWRVEKLKFFADRARSARQARDAQLDTREALRAHPELKSTFLTERAAEAFAAQRIADPRDRERFLDLIRGAMDASVKRGEPLPEIRLRDAPKPRKPDRDEPTR